MTSADAPRAAPRCPTNHRATGLHAVLAAAVVAVAGCGGGEDEAAPAAASVAADASGGATATAASATTPAASATCGIADFAVQALARINAVRAAGATCGGRGAFAPAGALVWHAALDAAAAAHSADMAARDYVEHASPDGVSADRRIAAAGYDARAWAENIAAGYPSVDAVIAGWLASDGHCANLMNSALHHVGLACVRTQAATYPTYWTLNLAAAR